MRLRSMILLGSAALVFGSSLHAQAQPSADSIAAVLKRDLRNLVVAQEAYFADHNTYAPGVGESPGAGVASWRASPGGNLVLSNVTAQGWSGVLTNASLTSGPIICGIYVGPATNAPNPAVKEEGAPGCWGTGVPPAGPPISAGSTAPEILASMRADLRNLVVAEEAYFADNNTYAPGIGASAEKGVASLVPGSGNNIVLSNVTAQGWTAVITNATLSSGVNTCGVFVGPASNAPNPVVVEEGRPACWTR